jgi:hypothetical protein
VITMSKPYHARSRHAQCYPPCYHASCGATSFLPKSIFSDTGVGDAVELALDCVQVNSNCPSEQLRNDRIRVFLKFLAPLEGMICVCQYPDTQGRTEWDHFRQTSPSTTLLSE